MPTQNKAYVQLNSSLAATIANGASLSDAVETNGRGIVAVRIPSGWTAANLTFQVSVDGGTTFVNAYDSAGAEITCVVTAADTFISVNSAVFIGADQIKVRSGTSGTPVNQSGGDVVTLIVRPV